MTQWRSIHWYPSPQFSLADDKSWWSSHGEKYVDALVGALPAGTPGLALWDVVNEPESGGASGLPGEKGTRWLFVQHFVKYFQSKTKSECNVRAPASCSADTERCYLQPRLQRAWPRSIAWRQSAAWWTS